MSQVKEKKEKAASPFEQLRRDVIAFLHGAFRSGLAKLPTSLPFSEIKFFDGVAAVRRHLMAAPRAVIQTALDNPGVYLEADELDPGKAAAATGSVEASLPDLGIAYKLHSECGRLINLFDWMQSWVSVVADGDADEADGDGGGDGEAEIDPHHQARFTQSVSSLQFLGFVKPSKRKTDHVQRLTWSGPA